MKHNKNRVCRGNKSNNSRGGDLAWANRLEGGAVGDGGLRSVEGHKSTGSARIATQGLDSAGGRSSFEAQLSFGGRRGSAAGATQASPQPPNRSSYPLTRSKEDLKLQEIKRAIDLENFCNRTLGFVLSKPGCEIQDLVVISRNPVGLPVPQGPPTSYYPN